MYDPRGWLWLALFAAVIVIAIPVLRLVFSPDSALHVSDYYVLLIGKIMCYEIGRAHV